MVLNTNIDKPLISIIIPTFNRSKELVRAIQSVVDQTYTNWELIIVDNYSTDNTEEVICKFNESRIKYVKNNNNGLIIVSRNKGLELASGKYIAFLDSDDWWTKTKLTNCHKYFSLDFDLYYHDLYIVKKIKKYNYLYKISRSKKSDIPVFNDLVQNGNYISNSSVIVKKDILSNGLPLDEKLNALCDFHSWLELSQVTNKFYKIPDVHGYYWIGGGNYTNPKRTLENLTRLNEVYNSIKISDSTWFIYSNARCLYLIGSYKEAKYYLLKLFRMHISIYFQIKIVYMLLKVKLKVNS